ncbi:MAG: hypothetical protein ACRETL_18085, partial [Gammaproteobacteria bacterium]
MNRLSFCSRHLVDKGDKLRARNRRFYRLDFPVAGDRCGEVLALYLCDLNFRSLVTVGEYQDKSHHDDNADQPSDPSP